MFLHVSHKFACLLACKNEMPVWWGSGLGVVGVGTKTISNISDVGCVRVCVCVCVRVCVCVCTYANSCLRVRKGYHGLGRK
jgi:hypothetical protein